MTHEIKELAAAYALGVLERDDARRFADHLEFKCSECARELSSFEETLADLSLAVEAVEPPASLKGELKMRVSGSRFYSVFRNEGEWHEVMCGVRVKQLHLDLSSGISTSLVRMMPGTSLPRHGHATGEQVLVLEGDCNINEQKLGPGDFHYAEAGSVHDSTYTVTGTMFLLIASQDYQFTD
ncbi:MAG TPA: cupin domain-containing protein [Blastocatellia bacterium]|nr:cupin domain-containing protein [Blastocatellia bacterium]